MLLCSDGLTGPVGEEEIARLLHATRDGHQACRRLLAAANREGGPDNITVVLLRVEPAEPDERAGDLGGEPEGRGADTAELAPARRGRDGGTRAGQVVEIRTLNERPSDFDAAALGQMASRQGAQPAPGLEDDLTPRGGRRVLAAVFGLVVIAAILVGGGSFLLSRSFFVGLDDEGLVTIYSGLPQNVAGVALERVHERTRINAADLPAVRRACPRTGHHRAIAARRASDGPEPARRGPRAAAGSSRRGRSRQPRRPAPRPPPGTPGT